MALGTTASTAPAHLRPMRIGEIIDRALRLTAGVFRRFLLLFVILAMFNTLAKLPVLNKTAPAAIATLLGYLISVYLGIASTIVAAHEWRGIPVSDEEVNSRLTFNLLVRLFVLAFGVALTASLCFVLFIIPGIVYLLNRCLAWYILVVEDTSSTEAIRRSTSLMKHGRWYRTDSPIARVSAISILGLIVSGILGVAQFGTIAFFTGSAAQLAAAALLFAAQIFLVFTHVWITLCYLGFYYDLRARYEGLDIASSLAGLRGGEPNAGSAPASW